MKAVLKREGDKYLIELDANTLDDWKVDPEQVLEITAVGDTLTVSPAGHDSRQDRFEKAMERLVERYGETLKRLSE